MEQQIFEGTWEQILQHGSALTGKRVRLILLTSETANEPVTDNLDQVLQGRVGRVNFQPSNLSERTEEAFCDLLEAKYNSSGLNQ